MRKVFKNHYGVFEFWPCVDICTYFDKKGKYLLTIIVGCGGIFNVENLTEEEMRNANLFFES